MIFDVTGTELTPGNDGKDCLGNGEHFDENGEIIECCCDECDFLRCCTEENWEQLCKSCKNNSCPRKE